MSEHLQKYIVTTFQGLENVLAREIRQIGGRQVRPLVRAVEFYGERDMLYRANLQLATGLRILRPLAHLRNIKSVAVLYNKMYEIPWEEYFDASHPVYFHFSGHLDTIPNARFVSQKTKDALVDRFRDLTGKRPDVHKDRARIRINLHLFRDQITVSLDSSGLPLFKRGYRTQTGPAPLNEVLAAGLIRLAGWDGSTHLIDPMCGSGTLPIEAALMAMHIPPGIFREEFAFMFWRDFDRDAYRKIRVELEAKIRPLNPTKRIIGSDKAEYVIQKALENAQNARVAEHITLQTRDFFRTRKNPGPNTLIFNPPYDRRIGIADPENFFRRISNHLKNHYPRSRVWIISEQSLDKYLRMRPFKRYKLMNGKIPVIFAGYQID